MANLENQLTAAALKYLGETADKRSAEAIWRKAMIQYLGGSATLGRLSLNALAARTARQVTGQTFSGASLDSLLLRWAYAVAGVGTPGRLSLDAVAMRAANKYLTAPPAPTNTVAPVVSGTPSVGQVLTTTNGTWTGSPTGYTYQYRRNGTAIAGATASTYTAQAADVGTTLTCAVTATNAGGSATAVSNGVTISAAKTYADWQVEAARLATNGQIDWEVDGTLSAGSYRTFANTVDAGSMTGSSWNAPFRNSPVAAARILQHALPSFAVWDNQRAAGLVIFFRVISSTAPSGFAALDRNAFTSTANGVTTNARACDLVIRWDASTQKAMQSNPSIGGAETEYTGWPP